MAIAAIAALLVGPLLPQARTLLPFDDEALSLLCAQSLADGAGAVLPSGHAYPRDPLFHQLLALFARASDTLLGMRLLSLLAFAGVVGLVLAPSGLSWPVRLMVVGLVAGLVLEQRYAVAARSYLMLQLLCLGAVQGLLSGSERGRWGAAWCLVLACGTHKLGFLVVPGVGFGLVLASGWPALWCRQSVLVVAGTLAFGVWAWFGRDALPGGTDWAWEAPGEGLRMPVQTLGGYFDYFTGFFHRLLPWAWVLPAVALLAHLRGGPPAPALRLLFGILLVPVLVLSGFHHKYGRYLLYLWPLYLLWVAYAVDWWAHRLRWRPQVLSGVGAAGIALLALLGPGDYAIPGRQPLRHDGAIVYDALARQRGPHDVVITTNGPVTWWQLGHFDGLLAQARINAHAWGRFPPGVLDEYVGRPLVDGPMALSLLELQAAAAGGDVWVLTDWKLRQRLGPHLWQRMASSYQPVLRDPAAGVSLYRRRPSLAGDRNE